MVSIHNSKHFLHEVPFGAVYLPLLQHGRVKVKTTEEQAEAKKKEMLQKLEKSRQLSDTIHTKVGSTTRIKITTKIGG